MIASKKILNYFIWVLIALLSAFVYMRIILGAKPESTSVFMAMFDWLYEYAFIYIGLILGSIITFLFVLTDFFYLNKRLKSDMKSTILRFFIIVAIAVIVCVTHYVLEKVIDVI